MTPGRPETDFWGQAPDCHHVIVLLTVTTTRAGDRPGLPAGQAPGPGASFDVPTGTAYVCYPGGDRRSAARPRCCSTWTRPGWSRRGAGSGPGGLHPGPVRQRPPVRRVQPAGRGADQGLPHARMRGRLDASARSWPRHPIPLEVRIPALRCRGGADLVAAAVRAAGLDGRRRRRSRWTTTHPEWGDEPVRRPHADRRRCGWPTRSTTCTCCCRCSTTPSTTGWRRTRSTSCCGPARAGWPTTRSGS